MLHFELLRDRNILVVTPDGPLEQADFEQFARQLEPLIASAGKVAGLMFDAKSFPGWRNLGAFVSHLRFVADHHRQIERIAVVSDSRWLKMLPRIATHVVKPDIRHFAAVEKTRALAWLETGR
jgi:hypothetical protein